MATDQQFTAEGVLSAYKEYAQPGLGDDHKALKKWTRDVLLDAMGGKTVQIDTPQQSARVYILRPGEQPPARALGDYAKIRIVARGEEKFEVEIAVGGNARHDKYRIPLSSVERIIEVSETQATVEGDVDKAVLKERVSKAFAHYASALLPEYHWARKDLATATEARRSNDRATVLAETRYARTQKESDRRAIDEILKPHSERLVESEREYLKKVEETTARLRSYAGNELLAIIKGIPLRLVTEEGTYDVTVDGNASLHMDERARFPLTIHPKEQTFFPIALERIVDVEVREVPIERKRDLSGERRAYDEQIREVVDKASERVQAQKGDAQAQRPRPTIIPAGQH